MGIDPLRFVMLKGVNLYGSEHMKPLGVEHRRVGLVKVEGWEQARLQMQIEHARAAGRTFTFFSNSKVGATGLCTSKEVWKKVP